LGGNNNIGKAWCRLATTTLISPVVGWQKQHLYLSLVSIDSVVLQQKWVGLDADWQ
jgi:hypothetical protein